MMELSWGLPGAMPTRSVLRAPLGAGWELQCVIAAPRARPLTGLCTGGGTDELPGKGTGRFQAGNHQHILLCCEKVW